MAATRRATPALLLLAACGGGAGGDRAPVTPPTAAYTLSVSPSAAGNGRVASTPSGIDCLIAGGTLVGPQCMAVFPAGTTVTLTAVAGSTAMEFAGWSGPCAGTAECRVTLRENAALSAGFRARVQTLTLSLQSPNADDGALLLSLVGPGILAIRPAAGLELGAAVDSSGGGVARGRLLLRGPIASGALLQLDVPGAAAAGQYTVRVEQAAAGAGGGYARRADLGAYQATLR